MPRILILFLLVVALALPAAAAARVVPAPAPRPMPVGVKAARFARTLVGVRYSWGGVSPRSGFDCSGLVRYVYRRFGIALPHHAASQFRLGRRVPRSALRPGDLVFFAGASHVGVYVGRGRIVNAQSGRGRVSIARLGGAWFRDTYAGARRIVS